MSSAIFLNVYDRSMKKTAVLQNAVQITETQEINQIYHLTFTMPSTDEKVQYLQPFHFVRWGETGQMYRIVKVKWSEADVGTVSVDCEHVITTLIDTIMFGSLTIGGTGMETDKLIKKLLEKQTTVLWELGTCDLSGAFEYGFEQENLLNAVYSVPKCFTTPYYWDFDTTGTKWKLHLRKIKTSINPEYYIRAKQNLLSQGSEQENSTICTRIYPLGYGEGVNQLNISSVNDGVPYLQNDTAIAQYGVIEKVLVDRRFENAASLKAYAQTVLDGLSIPAYSRSFDVADLYPITGQEINNARVGKICKLTEDGTIAYITKTVRVLDDPGNLQIELSTKATDVASTIADLADRVRIESVYSQGATQLYQHSKDANAAPVLNKNGTIKNGKGMMLSLYFPSEMRQINKVLLKVQLKKFRSYSATTDSYDGQSVDLKVDVSGAKTTSQTNTKTYTTTEALPAAQTTKMTAASGSNMKTTDSGVTSGQSSYSTGGKHLSTSKASDEIWTDSEFDYAYTGAFVHYYPLQSMSESDKPVTTGEVDDGAGGHYHEITSMNFPSIAIPKSQLRHTHNFSVDFGTHSHSFSIPSHSHSLNISHQHSYSIAHTHTFACPPHTHGINIPNLSGSVTIPPHDHKILPGIFEASETPTKFYIYVGGKLRETINATNWNGDISEWLLNAQDKIQRDTWISLEIVPDKLAYVVSSVFVQGFVQSRGDHTY